MAGMRAVLCLLLLASGCTERVHRTLLRPDQLAGMDRKAAFLKAHMRDGTVYVLSSWTVDEPNRMVSGTGELLGLNRERIETGSHTIRLDDVAIFESNKLTTTPSTVGLTIVTGASLVVTAVCLTNTKACFGSCPTFYVTDGERPILQAEGFSDSVAPSLEATDVDALALARPTGRTVEVRMTNEALETHVVRFVNLLAAPRPDGGRVFAAPDGLWQATRVEAPLRCRAEEGDCAKTIAALDGRERWSATDGKDLAAREEIQLELPVTGGGRHALVVASRQTLLSTFVFYQGLAYMGTQAGHWIAALERGDKQVLERAGSVLHVLGGIEVVVNGEVIGEIRETGPLATDVHLVHLPAGARHVTLRMTRGHWRLDQLALATLGEKVTPVRLAPVAIDGRRGTGFGERPSDETLEKFPMVTLPGDEVRFKFELPGEPAGYELFLESRGYYLEWMRDEWMREEDATRAALMVLDPARMMRMLAPAFKHLEPTMETLFWGSRYENR
jgi:hypothetical protein